MTTYAPDTAATALVLYSKCNARYDLIANEFRIIYSYEVKINGPLHISASKWRGNTMGKLF